MILFNEYVLVNGGTGNLGIDTDFRNGNYSTIAYYQHFQKGNYFQFIYPSFSIKSGSYSIKITKFDSDINIRILDKTNPVETLFFDNCEKPMYLLFRNTPLNIGVRPLFFSVMIHSGEFSASYKENDYMKETAQEFSENYKTLDLESCANQLQNNNSLNIVELKCKSPGVITVFEYMYQNNAIYPIEGKGIVHNIIKKDYDLYIYPEKDIKDYYIELYHICQNSIFDMTNIDKKKYDNQDAHVTFSPNGKTNEKKFTISLNKLDFSWFMSVLTNSGQEVGTVLTEENKEYNVYDNKRIIIPISTTSQKKNIKIKSSLNKFYWSLEFTQENDINFIPFPFGHKLKYENSNYINIRNPYSFDKKNKNYYYFVVMYHYNNNQSSLFNYEYTDEEKNIEDVNDDKGKKSFLTSPIFWTLFVLFLLAIGGFVYYKFFRKKANDIENLVQEAELNKI